MVVDGRKRQRMLRLRIFGKNGGNFWGDVWEIGGNTQLNGTFFRGFWWKIGDQRVRFRHSRTGGLPELINKAQLVRFELNLDNFLSFKSL